LFSKQINDSYKQYACFYILSSVSVSCTYSYQLVLLATSARRSSLHNSFVRDIAEMTRTAAATVVQAGVQNKLNKLKTKIHGLSPRENYTDRATVVFRRSDCQLFTDRWCHVVSVTDPYGRILGFLDRSCYFSIK
jgi:hypothetical protein